MLHAVSLADGSLDWRREGVGARGLLPVGNALFASAGDDLLALDGATGAGHWRAHDPGATRPLCFADGVVFCTGPSTVVALDAATGAVEWHTVGALGDRTEHRGAVGEDHVFLAAEDGPPSVIALDRESGRERWALQQPAGVRGLAVDGERLYTTTDDPAAVLELSATDGSVRREASSWADSSAWLVSTGAVLYVRGDEVVFGLDLADGSRVAGPTPIEHGDSLVAAGGRLYLDAGQRLHALEGSV